MAHILHMSFMKFKYTGFTLLEVIVSMCIMALVFLAVFRSIGGVIEYSDLTDKRFRLSIQLDKFVSHLLSCHSAHRDLAPGEHSGTYGKCRVNWSIGIRGAGLKKIEIEVIRKRRFLKAIIYRSVYY